MVVLAKEWEGEVLSVNKLLLVSDACADCCEYLDSSSYTSPQVSGYISSLCGDKAHLLTVSSSSPPMR